MIELDKFLLKDLMEIIKQLDIDVGKSRKKSELIDAIDEYFNQNEGFVLADGVLDIMADGYGFLRETSVEKIFIFQLLK